MENFRELEKEFKKKQYSKKALQGSKHGKGAMGRNSSSDEGSENSSDDDHSDQSDNDDLSNDYDEDINPEDAYGEEGAETIEE